VAPDRIKKVAVNLFKKRDPETQISALQREYENMIFRFADNIAGAETRIMTNNKHDEPNEDSKRSFLSKESLIGVLVVSLLFVVIGVVVSYTRTESPRPPNSGDRPSDNIPFIPRLPNIPPAPFSPSDQDTFIHHRTIRFYATVVLSILVIVEIFFIISFLARSLIKKQKQA
jgi:hypothetical protein